MTGVIIAGNHGNNNNTEDHLHLFGLSCEQVEVLHKPTAWSGDFFKGTFQRLLLKETSEKSQKTDGRERESKNSSLSACVRSPHVCVCQTEIEIWRERETEQGTTEREGENSWHYEVLEPFS